MQLREGLAIVAALAATLMLAGPAAGSALAASACPALSTQTMVVTGITAVGGLVTAEGEEVRLAGLAFPQVSGATPESAGGSPLATAIARLATGPVQVEVADSPDRYGRIRAHVYAQDGRWLQAELVVAGLAIVRPEGGDPGCLRALLALEAAARGAGAGLWADSRNVAKASDQSSLLAEIGLYALVEGRIVSVGYGSRMVFLDFGRSFRTDFTVMVQKSLVPRLVEAGITVESLAGRAVRVRGVIEESGGPAIRLTDPLALELLDREE